jgi:hypothetical protein
MIKDCGATARKSLNPKNREIHGTLADGYVQITVKLYSLSSKMGIDYGIDVK